MHKNMYELTKSDKKIARKVIETGLQRDFETSILDIDKIIGRWKKKELTNREAYHEIFSKVKENDKYIARVYDDLRGSTYLITIIGLLNNKVLSEADLGEFNEGLRNYLLGVREVLK